MAGPNALHTSPQRSSRIPNQIRLNRTAKGRQDHMVLNASMNFRYIDVGSQARFVRTEFW